MKLIEAIVNQLLTIKLKYEVCITNGNRQNLKITWEIIFKCTRIQQKSISILCSSIQFNWPNYHTFKLKWFGLENWNTPNKLRNTADNIFDNILPHCSYAQMLMKQMWFVIIVKIIQENINESSNEMWIFQKPHFVLIAFRFDHTFSWKFKQLCKYFQFK